MVRQKCKTKLQTSYKSTNLHHGFQQTVAKKKLSIARVPVSGKGGAVPVTKITVLHQAAKTDREKPFKSNSMG